jgi:hypothetical protein
VSVKWWLLVIVGNKNNVRVIIFLFATTRAFDDPRLKSRGELVKNLEGLLY